MFSFQFSISYVFRNLAFGHVRPAEPNDTRRTSTAIRQPLRHWWRKRKWAVPFAATGSSRLLSSTADVDAELLCAPDSGVEQTRSSTLSLSLFLVTNRNRDRVLRY